MNPKYVASKQNNNNNLPIIILFIHLYQFNNEFIYKTINNIYNYLAILRNIL